MNAIVGVIITLTLLGVIMRLIIGGMRLGPFNPKRAQMRSTKATGSNALLILAAVQLGSLGVELAEQSSSLHLDAAAAGLLIPFALIVGVIMLVADHSLAEAVIGTVGAASAFTSVTLRYGPSGALTIIVLAMLLLFVLGVARGFLRIT